MLKKFISAAFVTMFIFPLIATAASCPNLSRNLSFGSRGTDVVQLQQFLISQNLLAVGNDSGYFGRLTQTAVRQFQCRTMNLCSGSSIANGYGVVGQRTRSAIANACIAGTSQTGNQTTPNNFSNSNSAIESLLAQIRALQLQINALQNAPATPTTNTSCSPLAPQTQMLSCPSGQNGTITQTRVSSCPGPVWSSWTTTLNTCTAVQTSGTCTPHSPQTQTFSCPTGQTGLITQTRTSSCVTSASAPVWSSWATTSTSCTQAFSLDYPKSGERYSEITGMFNHQSGQLWTPDSSTTPGVFVHQDVWSNEGQVARAHLGTDATNWNDLSKRNYEEFTIRNGWIVQTGWTTWGEQGFFKRVAKKVTFTWNPGTALSKTYDLTDMFKGQAPPYVLEEIPSAPYEIYVEAVLINTADNTKIYDDTDRQQWDPPAQVDTVFFGKKLGIIQHEWYTATWPPGDPRGTESTHRDHTMAKGIGYGARIYDYANGGWLAGEKFIWQW